MRVYEKAYGFHFFWDAMLSHFYPWLSLTIFCGYSAQCLKDRAKRLRYIMGQNIFWWFSNTLLEIYFISCLRKKFLHRIEYFPLGLLKNDDACWMIFLSSPSFSHFKAFYRCKLWPFLCTVRRHVAPWERANMGWDGSPRLSSIEPEFLICLAPLPIRAKRKFYAWRRWDHLAWPLLTTAQEQMGLKSKQWCKTSFENWCTFNKPIKQLLPK